MEEPIWTIVGALSLPVQGLTTCWPPTKDGKGSVSSQEPACTLPKADTNELIVPIIEVVCAFVAPSISDAD